MSECIITRQNNFDILDAYPIGSIYLSINSTNPSKLFGGTWEQIKDTFLLAAGSTYTAGSTGGSATHTLTINQIPSHNHSIRMKENAIASGSSFSRISSAGSISSETNLTNYVGGSQPHNNMPPYLTVYMWKRVS